MISPKDRFLTIGIFTVLISLTYQSALAQNRERRPSDSQTQDYTFEPTGSSPCENAICYEPPAGTITSSRFEMATVFPTKPACTHQWAEVNILNPVFYGYQDYGPPELSAEYAPLAYGIEFPWGSSIFSIPGKLRIFFPSMDGSPQNAALPLDACGLFPLVIFLHGQSYDVTDTDHYLDWRFPAYQLARSGYVVAVPDLGTPEGWLDEEQQRLEQLVSWMRHSWAGSSMLSATTAVVGHSRGALMGGRYTAEHPNDVQAFVSLSGAWSDWARTDDVGTLIPNSNPLFAKLFQQPTLLVWGTGEDLEALNDDTWDALDQFAVKHKLAIEQGKHYDYILTLPASVDRGPCELTPFVVGDLVSSFLSRYAPPEGTLNTFLPFLIPPNLIPPPLGGTPEQEFFLGGHLVGLTQIDETPGCHLTHSWQVGANSGELTLGP